MKRVLLITSLYPPEREGGTIRAEKLVKYLPTFGWEAIVLTAMPPPHLRLDATEKTQIARAPRMDVAGIYVRFRQRRKQQKSPVQKGAADRPHIGPTRRMADWFMVPDDRMFWIPGAVMKGAALIRKYKPDVIYATAPHFSVLLVGALLKRLTHVPLVAEFRDPWMVSMFRHPRPLHFMETLEGKLERASVRNADKIICVTEEITKITKNQFQSGHRDHIYHVPNGFDPEDFVGITPQRSDRFRILHAGSFYGPRSPEPYLEGLHRFLLRNPRLMEKIETLFLGPKVMSAEMAIARLGLEKCATQIGVKSHRETIEYMLGADVLLLVPGPGNPIPGKMFEYIAAQRPILALAEDGFVSDLLRREKLGWVADPASPEQIALVLESVLHPDRGEKCFQPSTQDGVISRYDRRLIAQQIAEILEGTITANHGVQKTEVYS